MTTGRRPDEDDDAEDGFALRSIWDADGDNDDGDTFDALRLVDPDVSPVDPIPQSARADPDAWLEAEAALARPLAGAVEAFARLDERLRAWDPVQARRRRASRAGSGGGAAPGRRRTRGGGAAYALGRVADRARRG